MHFAPGTCLLNSQCCGRDSTCSRGNPMSMREVTSHCHKADNTDSLIAEMSLQYGQPCRKSPGARPCFVSLPRLPNVPLLWLWKPWRKLSKNVNKHEHNGTRE